MRVFTVPVIYQVWGLVEVEAVDKKDLMSKLSDGEFVEGMPIPNNSEYIDGTYEIDVDNTYYEELQNLPDDDEIGVKQLLKRYTPTDAMDKVGVIVSNTTSLFELFKDEQLSFTTVLFQNGALIVSDVFADNSEEYIMSSEYAQFNKELLEEKELDSVLCVLGMWCKELYKSDDTEKELFHLFDNHEALYVVNYSDSDSIVKEFSKSAKDGDSIMFLWC